MMNARRVGRLGIFALGLGIGAAVASTPGIASADTSTDVLSLLSGVDPFSALATPMSPAANLAVSFDGFTLFHEGSAVATTGSGTFDFAIASGADSYASANGGFFDFASADGTNAYAVAGGAAGTTGNNFDSAADIGNNTLGGPGFHDGVFAGAASLIGNNSPTGGSGSFDTAIQFGNNGPDSVGDGGNSGAFAGAGGLIGLSGNGNANEAIVFGNLNGENLGPAAVDGSNDSASQFGNSVGLGGGALAGFGNNDVASVIGGTSSADAGGHANFATGVIGPLGNNDTAFVFDPSGPLGSTADAGSSATTAGNFDLAGVFGDGLHATAQGGNFLTDILPSLFGGAAATDVSSFLSDLLPGLGSGAATDAGSFLTDIVSSLGF